VGLIDQCGTCGYDTCGECRALHTLWLLEIVVDCDHPGVGPECRYCEGIYNDGWRCHPSCPAAIMWRARDTQCVADTRGRCVWVHSGFELTLDVERPRHLRRVIYKGGYEYLGTGDTDSSSSDSEGEDTLSGSEWDSSETDPSDDDECFERALVADSARWEELEEVETRDPDVAAWYYMFG
jgi:hypothetical protein